MGFPGGSDVKNLPAIQETQVGSLDRKDPLEKGMATHYNILAWIITWTEEPGGLQFLAPALGVWSLSHWTKRSPKRFVFVTLIHLFVSKYLLSVTMLGT